VRRDLLTRAQAEGRDWYYGDHGYFRRGRYYRITRNAYQPDGTIGTCSRARFDQLHVNLAPAWTRGVSIVVCPNSPAYMSWFGIDAHQWCADLVLQLTHLTKRPIVVRWKVDAKLRPLYIDLHNAHLVVVFSSASAIEALAAGVPVCTLASWASSAPMGITDLTQVESPYYPDLVQRDQFLFNLAHRQWTLEEMRNGTAWRALNEDR